VSPEGAAPAGRPRVLIVGIEGGTNVGPSLQRAAAGLGLDGRFCDMQRAYAGPRLLRKLYWQLGGHRPQALRGFSREVVAACDEFRPRWLLSTGLSPLDAAALGYIGELAVERVNYLTDDPWNPTLRSRWFLEAIRSYDRVYSTRWANIGDLTRHGCRGVAYLPFAFDPELSFPEQPATAAERAGLAADVVFVGGADRDRVPYIAALGRAGLKVSVYGDRWDRFPQTRPYYRGYADPPTLRRATGAAKVALCLVRRANRDGHVMRSFEIAAIGACMLAEDTEEHRALFGADGAAVAYFRSIPEMVEKARDLVGDEARRRRLAEAAQGVVVRGGHTYSARLRCMLGLETEGP
jgi:spore maturation protein CgeB